MVGERLAFTASAGFCIFIAALIFWIQPDFNLKKPGITGAVTGIVLLLLAGRTITRNNDWKDTMTLMRHDIKHLENSAQANNMYARTLMGESMQNKNLNSTQRLEMQQTAIAHFDKATELWPAFFNAYFDKGMAARIAQNQDKAIESFRKVIEMNPQFTDAYTNLIEVYEITGKKDEQLATAQQLMEVSDSNISYALLSRSYFVRNEFDKSAETLKKGLEKYPNDELLLKNLEIVNQQKKNIQN
ncbi:tetratricopeptide repeat protein [Ancylostoma ceylanicum]|uniref:Tetratricopeptide repeat protein n=1 Tax=Ancylostoma ceylanicum TaxID=53326 RepID=A0A0D6L7C0_9BILA|nr:tetratricopeptide repeat protein [Ancylostoma ceylanicum]